MQKPAEVNQAIDKGLAYLARQQEADGSFLSFSSASIEPFRRVRSWQTTFVPALMLTALAGTDTSKSRQIRDSLAKFLFAQKSQNGSFNYWSKQAPEYKTMAYPDDLDDTFCALAGLYLHDPQLISQQTLAQAIKLLLATEVKTGGPYRTWIVSESSEPIWLDVDLAVNSNIAYFLSLIGSNVPTLKKLMNKAIVDDTFHSPYYPTIYSFMYYFARAYAGPHKQQLLKKVVQLHASDLSALDSALCLSARLRLGDKTSLHPLVTQLLSQQRRDGSWPAAAFYADPVKNNKLYYNGAPALTTALVIEALELYRKTGVARPPKKAGQKTDIGAAASTLNLAKIQSHTLEEDLRKIILASLKRIAGGDNGSEIIGLPECFNQSLGEPYVSYGKDFFKRLSLANLYGWLAYTIYDDFLDEQGRAELLSAANVALRESLHNFCEAVPIEAFTTLVYETFDTIDSANAWELAHCRCRVEKQKIHIEHVPDYGNLMKLAERSLGHTLAPLAILIAKDLRPGDSAFRHTQQALSHYLIVRQLNDDLHDWQTDLENGHLSYAVARILKDMGIRPGNYSLSDLRTKSQRQFWYHTLPVLCREMQQHVTRGRESLNASGLFRAKSAMSELFDKLEMLIADTLARQHDTADFLRYYRKEPAGAK